MRDTTNGFRGGRRRRRRSAVVVNSATPPPPPPSSLEVPAMIKNASFFGFFDEAAKAASVQDATAEHLIEAFEQLPKRDQVLMVKKLLNGALREDEVQTRVMEEAMVMEEEKRTAPEVKIRNDDDDDDDDEKKLSISSSSSSAPTTVTDEREILERAVREMPNASPEQREKAAEILRRLEEETERVRMQSEGKEDDDKNNIRSSRLEKDFENDEETENRGEDNSPFEDEDIVWDLRSAVASLTTVAKAKLIPPLAFGTGFAALALVLTKFIGGDDAGNETMMDDARRNDNDDDDDARASSPPPPSTSSAIMNDRNDGDSGDVASPLLPMEEAKRLLFENQAIQPPRTMTAAKSNAQKILKNRRRGVASTKNTSSAGNGNGVLWKRKEEEEVGEEEEDEALELAALEENDDFEEPFEDEDENENAEEESIALATAEGNEDEDEDEDEDDQAELPPPPPTSATNKKQRRRPPPDLTSASFLSEEDREKNFDDIRARRPR